MPWAAARGVMVPVLDKIERLDAALAEARHRYQQPLDDRDDLRGLLQSFRDKAAAHGLGENSDLEPLYRRAESYLWAAPCDLAAARPLVDRYVAVVNTMIAAKSPQEGTAREVHPARLRRQRRRRLLRRLRAGACRPAAPATPTAASRRRSEHAHDPIRHDPARSRAARFGALGRGQSTDASAHEHAADLAARRRPDPGPVGARHRSAPGADGSADRRRGQAVLLGVPGAGRSVARRCARSLEGLLPEVPHAVRLRSEAAARCARRRAVRGGRRPGPRRDGLDLPRQRPQRQRSLGRAEGPAQQRRPRCGTGGRCREAVPRRGRAPADRRDLQLRHRIRRRVVHRHGVRRRPLAEHHAQGPDEGHRQVLADPGRSGDRLHRRDPAGLRRTCICSACCTATSSRPTSSRSATA